MSNSGDDESRAEILSQNMNEIVTYKKNMGAYDIAVVKLHGKVGGLNYLKVYHRNIKEKIGKNSTPRLLGVAVNGVKENKTGSYALGYSDTVRHLAIFTLDEGFKNESNPLVASFTLPPDYQEKCQSMGAKKGVYPDRFVYNTEISNLPFLMGIAQPGDSGGPLITRINDQYYAVGVAQQINYIQCFDRSTQKLAPNGTFFNVWTPIFDHLKWLREKILYMGAETYQEDLFK
jgi:hypothetical protein